MNVTGIKREVLEDVAVHSRARQMIDSDQQRLGAFVLRFAYKVKAEPNETEERVVIPAYRVLDAIMQNGMPYCEGGGCAAVPGPNFMYTEYPVSKKIGDSIYVWMDLYLYRLERGRLVLLPEPCQDILRHMACAVVWFKYSLALEPDDSVEMVACKMVDALNRLYYAKKEDILGYHCVGNRLVLHVKDETVSVYGRMDDETLEPLQPLTESFMTAKEAMTDLLVWLQRKTAHMARKAGVVPPSTEESSKERP